MRGKLIIALLLVSPEMANAQFFVTDAMRARVGRMLNVIESADSNKDKFTTQSEFRVVREAQARRFLNADRTVNLLALESDASVRNRQKKQMDTNGDGKVSVTEFGNFLPRAWREADGNNDNRISAAELKAARSAL
jgi:hypothetical protein